MNLSDEIRRSTHRLYPTAYRASCCGTGNLRSVDMIAHAMFALPLWEASLKVRTGGAQWLAEGVAAFGLVATILAGLRFQRPAVPWLVGLYITAAYWFTASTSFANPAVAIARSLTNTFSGIRPVDLPGFIASELAGAVIGLMLMNWLLRGSGAAAVTKEVSP